MGSWSLGMVVFVVVAVLVGAALQRASGTGVGLVVAPVLALMVGPGEGVLLTNSATVLSGLLLTLTAFRNVDWRTFRSLAIWAIPGAVFGAYLVSVLPAHLLQILIGLVVLTALLITVALPRLPHVTSPWARRTAGTIGGCFNTTAGIAAPAMVIYANLSRWDQVRFAATMQPTFLFMGLASVLLKVLAFPVPGMTLPPWWFYPVLALTILAGAGIGHLISKRISRQAARNVAMTLAFIGGVMVLLRGFGWI